MREIKNIIEDNLKTIGITPELLEVFKSPVWWYDIYSIISWIERRDRIVMTGDDIRYKVLLKPRIRKLVAKIALQH